MTWGDSPTDSLKKTFSSAAVSGPFPPTQIAVLYSMLRTDNVYSQRPFTITSYGNGHCDVHMGTTCTNMKIDHLEAMDKARDRPDASMILVPPSGRTVFPD